MRISDWSSDVCSSDLCPLRLQPDLAQPLLQIFVGGDRLGIKVRMRGIDAAFQRPNHIIRPEMQEKGYRIARDARAARVGVADAVGGGGQADRKSTRLNSSH